MKLVANPWRGRGLPKGAVEMRETLLADPAPVLSLLAHCPHAAKTPLVQSADLARKLGVQDLYFKDERARMGLGSFKALGAAYAIARDAHDARGDAIFAPKTAATALAGRVYCCASAGNHGLSMAAGARVFGASAVIFIAETVPESFAERLAAFGARVIRQGQDYEASMAAAKRAATAKSWHLLSDTSWPGYAAAPQAVMQGYLVLGSEIAEQWPVPPPSHVFLQAGVGGLAAAVAVGLRRIWGDGFHISVVEPAAAPALQASIEAGKPVVTSGPVSNMGRLDCKEPSHLALAALAIQADNFLTLDDDAVAQAIDDLPAFGFQTTPSGGAGYAGLRAMAAAGLAGLGADSRVLVILSECVDDA
ncbi:MAG: pyridoxal-phosphate dependent enzyme [Rhodobacteraceae bacterium]|nr:pyridoxal-phosphate dependent enzyme [Paracoccaceae bacterium]